MDTQPKRIPFPHPGDILREEYMDGLGIDVAQLARETGLTETYVQDLIHTRQSVTAVAAYRISVYFGGKS